MYNKPTNAHYYDSLLVYFLFHRSYMFRRQYVILTALCYVACQVTQGTVHAVLAVLVRKAAYLLFRVARI
jgi:hypothetical protein